MIKDGYEWLARFDKGFLKKALPLRNLLLQYYRPAFFEKFGYGIIYRFLGVHIFGKYLPTGGIQIRRLTKSKMQSYTLKKINICSIGI